MASDLEFLLTARDEASKTLVGVKGELVDLGNVAQQSFGKAGKASDSFTQFLREQRSEQRQQTFLFRQLRDVTGAAAIGLTAFGQIAGDSNEQMKRLNSALMSGYIAFQGIDFALSALKVSGGVGIAAIAGVAAVLLGLRDDAKATSDAVAKIFDFGDSGLKLESLAEAARSRLSKVVQEINERGFGAPTKENKARLEFLDSQRERLEAISEKLNEQIEQNKLINEITKEANDLGLKSKGQIEEQKKEIEAIAKHTDIFLAAQSKGLEEQVNLIKQLSPEYFKQLQFVAELETLLSRNDISLAQQIAHQNILNGLAKEESNLRKELPLVNVPKMPDNKDFVNSSWVVKLEEQYKSLGIEVDNVNSLIVSDTQRTAAMITDAFFGATVDIKKFFESMVRDVAQLLFEDLLKRTIVTGITSFLTGGIGAAVAPLAGSGGVGGVPLAGRRGGSEGFQPITIVVNTGARKAHTIDERREVARSAYKAIIREKW